MFSLLIVLLSFSEFLATKCLFLNDEPCMVRPTFIDMNPSKFKHYSFMINLNKYTGSCNVLSPKICIPKETKYINIIWKQTKMKLKQRQNIFNVIVNANPIVQHVNQNKSGIIKHVNVNVKVIVSVKKITVGILEHVFVRIVSI